MAAAVAGEGMQVPEREWKISEGVEIACGVGERKSTREADEREDKAGGVEEVGEVEGLERLGLGGVGGLEAIERLERDEGSELIILDRERLARTLRGAGAEGLLEGKLVAVVAGAVGAAETVCKHVSCCDAVRRHGYGPFFTPTLTPIPYPILSILPTGFFRVKRSVT